MSDLVQTEFVEFCNSVTRYQYAVHDWQNAGVHCERIDELEKNVVDAEEAMTLQEARFNRIASCVDALLAAMEPNSQTKPYLDAFKKAVS